MQAVLFPYFFRGKEDVVDRVSKDEVHKTIMVWESTSALVTV
jgi:hypothetical protein